jgi:hypothetical protein
MSKIDFKKTLKQFYSPPAGRFTLVDVPPMQFLMIDGAGDPNTAVVYTEAVEALMAVAFKTKFLSKKELERDYVVPPLEGLWWADDWGAFTSRRDKDEWSWTMMVMTPDWIPADMVSTAVAEVQAAKRLPALPRLRLETYAEGLSVQILHIGSYEDEAPVLQRMHDEFMPPEELMPAGKHHEIYLSDPRRVAPENLKTVLRQPVQVITV